MAANSKAPALAAGFGKRFVSQIWAAPAPAAVASLAPVFSRRRAVHVSSYDKNVDELVPPSVVPDHVIDANSDKYWSPHPTTGVFGPADEGTASAAGGEKVAAAPGSGGPSALDQTVWFRPLEDLDKPPQP
ncbi:unnamed protein product [Musa acuminata subsp. burmannicoides]